MKAPIKWLKDFVNIDICPKDYADALTMSGSKVEAVEELGKDFDSVVVGKIIEMEMHPDADKLKITKVDVGNEILQVVTGAPNVNLGDYIPLALVGSNLPGGKIKKSKLRGVESNGMMCSINELNLTREQFPDAPENGVYIFKGEPKLGTDVKEIMGLDDTVVEFEITSNRPDCFSILGLARESAVTLGLPLNNPTISLKEEEDDAKDYIKVEIENGSLCSRYAARVVKNVKIEPSPLWMRQRLAAAGVRPINNLVDITNYVMLELGQPMHAFDLNNIKGNKIIVRTANKDEEIITLDDQKRVLDEEMLVISDAERAVAVAGVMGGANSEVTKDTSIILLESATFNGSSVRKTAQKLGLRSEASSRFEKGLDVNNVINAINRAAQLIEELGAGTVCKGVVDCYPEKYAERTLNLNPDRINSFLGTSIDKEYMVKLFKDLEFKVDEKSLELTVPSFRPDVEREADLAEEVARFYGYNNITPTLLSGKEATQGRKTFKQKVNDIIKNTLIASGLHEIYTYSYLSPKVYDRLLLSKDSELRNSVVIMNPLGEDFSHMRTTTIPSMLNVVSTNYNRSIENGEFFEISNIYIPNNESKDGLPTEKNVVTVGMYGSVDFYDLKGAIENILNALGIAKYDVIPCTAVESFHPGRTAQLKVGDEIVGVFGEIHPEVAKNFDCPNRTYIAQIEISPLIENTSLVNSYLALPKFPAMNRDIAMLVKDEIMVKDIEAIIKQRGGNILENIKLFDVYKGQQVPEGMKSVAYALTFRAKDRTLIDDEVNKSMKKILNGLETVLGAQLR